MGKPQSLSFYSLLLEAVRQEGFPLVGALDLDSVDLSDSVTRYDQWLAEGHAGEMNYLVRGRERRTQPRLVYEKAQSILCVALPYPARPAGSPDPSQGVRYARYLRGEDYHSKMPRMLDSALQKVKSQMSTDGAAPLSWKICVDTSAILERTWAAHAGLGWIGKNGMLIHPQLGSYILLGFALLDRPVNHGPSPISNFCGNCRRCLDGCPTQAFVEPKVLDSKRCISYWTLEKRGPWSGDSEQLKSIGPWVAGCDICQEVCPFNQKISRTPPPVMPPSMSTEDGATALSQYEDLKMESETQFRERVKRSALNRIKPGDFRRNLEIAIANCQPRSDKEQSD